jgi:hypothetical protein
MLWSTNDDMAAIKFILGIKFWELSVERLLFTPNSFWQGPKTRFFGLYFLHTLVDDLRTRSEI